MFPVCFSRFCVLASFAAGLVLGAMVEGHAPQCLGFWGRRLLGEVGHLVTQLLGVFLLDLALARPTARGVPPSDQIRVSQAQCPQVFSATRGANKFVATSVSEVSVGARAAVCGHLERVDAAGVRTVEVVMGRRSARRHVQTCSALATEFGGLAGHVAA